MIKAQRNLLGLLAGSLGQHLCSVLSALQHLGLCETVLQLLLLKFSRSGKFSSKRRQAIYNPSRKTSVAQSIQSAFPFLPFHGDIPAPLQSSVKHRAPPYLPRRWGCVCDLPLIWWEAEMPECQSDSGRALQPGMGRTGQGKKAANSRATSEQRPRWQRSIVSSRTAGRRPHGRFFANSGVKSAKRWRHRPGGQTRAPHGASSSLSGRSRSRAALGSAGRSRTNREGARRDPIPEGPGKAQPRQLLPARPGGTRERSGASPGVSHRLAALAPGAPPQRLHVGSGSRPVREHGGTGEGPAVPGVSHGAVGGIGGRSRRSRGCRGSLTARSRGAGVAPGGRGPWRSHRRAFGSHGNGRAVTSPERRARRPAGGELRRVGPCWGRARSGCGGRAVAPCGERCGLSWHLC